jgi:hypothetical protein
VSCPWAFTSLTELPWTSNRHREGSRQKRKRGYSKETWRNVETEQVCLCSKALGLCSGCTVFEFRSGLRDFQTYICRCSSVTNYRIVASNGPRRLILYPKWFTIHNHFHTQSLQANRVIRHGCPLPNPSLFEFSPSRHIRWYITSVPNSVVSLKGTCSAFHERIPSTRSPTGSCGSRSPVPSRRRIKSYYSEKFATQMTQVLGVQSNFCEGM